MTRRAAVAVTGVLTSVVVAGTTVVAATAGPPSCVGRMVTVAAAPEIASAVAEVFAGSDSGSSDHCPVPTVEARDPAEVAAALRAGGSPRPDVWIPDSTIWADSAGLRGTTTPVAYPSIARSPVVLALARTAAVQLKWPTVPLSGPSLLGSSVSGATVSGATPPGPAGGAPVRLALAEPRRSAVATGVLLALQAATSGRPDAAVALTGALRAARLEAGPPTGAPTTGAPATGAPAAFAQSGASPGLMVPASEQSVWVRNAASGRSDLVAAYLPGAGTSLDYPFISLATDPVRAARVVRTFTDLQSDRGGRVLAAHGFRGAQGNAGPGLTTDLGVDPAASAIADVPAGDTVIAALRMFDVVNVASRTLAVLDVSGSMNLRVPDAGGATRIDLARRAAGQGLSLFGDDSQVGLWVFATDLTPTTDYRELAPVQPLGRGADGTSGRDRMEQALRQVAVAPAGDTGLYDTTLAAVRAARAGWDPQRVNTVVILTDGHNDDRNGITLPQLLSALRQGDDPVRPVPVLTIAYGPDSDEKALAEISGATGGATYRARDPRQVSAVFLEAISQRLCRPNCASTGPGRSG